MKRRKEFHLFPLGILLFALTLTIVSGRIAIHAADLNTELPANDSTEISSEIPTETPVVPSTENPKPVLQGLIHDKNGHFYFYQNGKKLKNRWKKVGKNKYYFGKNGQAVTGKKNISHYLCYFNKKGVLTRKIDKNKKMVALTYDDGPSVYTPTILKTLKKNDSVATFFVVGSRVSTYSKTVQKAYDNGCQIGNHTYDHKILTRVGKKEVQKQVSKTNRAVKKVIGCDAPTGRRHQLQHQIMGGNAFHHLVHRYLRLENAGFRKYPESRIEPCKGWRYRTDARSV